jgi:hypothetical protein
VSVTSSKSTENQLSSQLDDIIKCHLQPMLIATDD